VNNYFLKFVCAGLLFFAASARAIVHKAVLLSNGQQDIILEYDWHRDYEGMVKTNHEVTTNLNESFRFPYYPAWLVEDFSICEDNNDPVMQMCVEQEKFAARLNANKIASFDIMGCSGTTGLVQKLKNRGIGAQGIEFRHPWAILEYGVRNGILPDGTPITRNTLQQLVDITLGQVRRIAHLRNYDDGFVLNSFYRQIIDSNMTVFNLEAIKRRLSAGIENIEAILTEDVMVQISGGLVPLLDLLVMHKIHEMAREKLIIVFAGGTHCQIIQRVLLMMGYYKKYEAGIENISSNDTYIINNALNLENFYAACRLYMIQEPVFAPRNTPVRPAQPRVAHVAMAARNKVVAPVARPKRAAVPARRIAPVRAPVQPRRPIVTPPRRPAMARVAKAPARPVRPVASVRRLAHKPAALAFARRGVPVQRPAMRGMVQKTPHHRLIANPRLARRVR
jgi:hypothetical protein